MDVFFYEAFEEETRALRDLLPASVKAGFTRHTIQEQGDTSPPAGLISIRTQSEVPAAWAGAIRGILARSTGYDHLLRYSRTAGREVPCGYLPLYCSRAVAEQAALLWLALLRRLPLQLRCFRRFERDGLTGRECRGLTLLVVGVGNIGSEVVDIGRGLGMTVLGVDPVEKCRSLRYVQRDEGLAMADVVVCCMNLTEHNAGYFSYDVLGRVKRGAVFVNIARGEMSPAEDLLRLLDNGTLGGVGLDVYRDEGALAVLMRKGRRPPDAAGRAVLELAGRSDAVLTPHNAFNAREAVERKSGHSVEQVVCFLETGRFKWPVPREGDIP